MQALRQAAQNAGYKQDDIFRLFPNGAIDAVNLFSAMGNEKMLAELGRYSLETMRVPERIALAVKTRLQIYAQHREAIRKAAALHSMPMHALAGIRCLYATADAIWHATGDTSTDFNFYTKRMTLAGVYSSTLLFWLNDKSPEQEESWAFLARRLGNVSAFGKLKRRLFERRA